MGRESEKERERGWGFLWDMLLLLTDDVVRWDAHGKLVQNGREGEDHDGRSSVRISAPHKRRKDVSSEVIRDRFVPCAPICSETVAVPPYAHTTEISILFLQEEKKRRKKKEKKKKKKRKKKKREATVAELTIVVE